MNYSNPTLRSRLVDEYVIGTLQGGARRRFEQLLSQDEDLNHQTVEALYRLDSLANLLPQTNPSHEVWSTILDRIDVGVNTAVDVESADVVSTTDDNSHVIADLGWRLRFWRVFAMVSSLSAVALALYIALFSPSSNSTIAIVTDDLKSQPGWALALREDDPLLIVRAMKTHEIPEGSQFQLWMKPTDDEPVRSLGLISADGKTTLTLDDNDYRDVQKAVLFGVSVEPTGGSSTGQPTKKPLHHGQRIDL